ncbi:MAG TPA: respiratory nitrate reductase subunit gamma [Solirubrobacteraceae bacterium]|nr:respiratory nitrate reductase subunit gamma [Solirubrobacteraceae bacterium]
MSAGQILLWIVFPYVAAAVFVVGHWWRYRNDQFEWTTRSTQLLDRRILGWASPVFHYGALAAAAGHIIGECIPSSVTEAIGIPEHTYRWIAAGPGGVAGGVTLIGFIGLVYRRITSDRVRRNTTRSDYLTYLLLTVLIVMGDYMVFTHNVFTDSPYNYRDSISVWWQSLFYFDPNVTAATSAPVIYQLHAIIAWVFWASFPFSRLVHAWSIPLQYIGRPHIIYRRRFPAARWSTRGAPYRNR